MKNAKNRSNWLEILSEKGCYFAKAPDSPLVQSKAKGEQKREVLHGCQEEYSIEPPLVGGSLAEDHHTRVFAKSQKTLPRPASA